MALGLVLLVMILLFRSPTAGLLAAVPTFVTLLVVYGAMGARNVSLDIGTSMLASLIIGAGVDYAVHMVSAWRSREGDELPDAAARAAETTATAIWTNALMVAAGFFILTLGDARPLQNVGTLTASAMLVAALSTFVAIPCLARKRSYSRASVLEALEEIGHQ
jgi:predicted RND superfamily exporter protein